MNEQINQIRLSWIDDCKMFAMASVILGHIMAMFFKDLNGTEIFGRVMISYAMYLFVFISGIVNHKSLNRITSTYELILYYKKLSARILLPLFTWTTSVYIIDSSIHYFTNFWFLFMLAIVLYVSAFVYYCSKKYKFGNTLTFVLLLVVLSVIPFENVYEFAIVFIAGLISKRQDLFNRFNNRAKLKVVLLIITFTVWSVTFYFSKDHNFYEYPVIKLFRENIFYYFFNRQLCALSAVYLIASIFTFKTKYSYFSYWGSKTMPLYFVHVVILIYFLKPLLSNNNYDQTWTVLVFMFCIVLSLSTVIICGLIKYSITKRILLGEAN